MCGRACVHYVKPRQFCDLYERVNERVYLVIYVCVCAWVCACVRVCVCVSVTARLRWMASSATGTNKHDSNGCQFVGLITAGEIQNQS